MKIFKSLIIAAAAVLPAALASCDNQKSYAELLTDEAHATNAFLVNQRVVAEIPADTIFEVGINAPYYQIDEDGNVYMQVLSAGTKGNKAEYDELIYFRFTRYSLYTYTYAPGGNNNGGYYGSFTDGSGNDNDLTAGNASFRFGNMNNQNTYQWGTGIQLPLKYLPMDCTVNILIKSQAGLYNEIAYVVPYFYANVRYFKSQI